MSSRACFEFEQLYSLIVGYCSVSLSSVDQIGFRIYTSKMFGLVCWGLVYGLVFLLPFRNQNARGSKDCRLQRGRKLDVTWPPVFPLRCEN